MTFSPESLLKTMFYPEERVGLFIDGSNLYAAAKALEFDMDYHALLRFFSSQARLVRAYYYTAISEDQEFSSLRPLIDWLDYNGFTMITKPTREYNDPITGRKKIKGNMDIEIAIDVIQMSANLDHIVLFSGDGDFKRLVELVQRNGVRVTAISTLKSQPPMISDELRRQVDFFIDLKDIQQFISRIPGTKRDDNLFPEFNNIPQANDRK